MTNPRITGHWRVGGAAVMFGVLAGCSTARDRAHVDAGWFRADAGKLFYEVKGAGEPIVLIHGGQMDRRMWDEQFELLARNHLVVRYDVRGYGRSPHPTKVYANYEELRGLLDHLGIDRPTLVGLSLGGSIAIDFAIAHPDRVKKLVLVGPGMSGFDWSRDNWTQIVKTIEAVQEDDYEQAVDLWMNDPMMKAANENPAAAPRIRQLVRENMGCWLVNPYLERSLKPPAAERLKEIKAPTLVILGARDNADITRVCAKLEAEVPGAKKLVIGGAGHIVNMEQPQAFHAALAAFLAE